MRWEYSHLPLVFWELSHPVTPFPLSWGVCLLVSFCVSKIVLTQKWLIWWSHMRVGWRALYNEWPKKKKKNGVKKRTTSWFWMSGLCASWHSPWVETSRLWLWMEATEDYMSSWFLSLRGLLMLVLKWKKHKWRLQMEGTRNGGLPKGRDVLLNMNRLLSCECFLMFWVTDFSLCFFALDCAVAAKWKNFVGLLAAPSICYCCLTAVITNIVIMVIIIIS